MPISLQQLAEEVEPTRTVLLFGAGSSLPSGAASVSDLLAHLAATFKLDADGYSLSEFTSIIEQRQKSRKSLIGAIRQKFKGLKPTGGLLNLPLYEWKSLFTTNYDHLIEDAYTRAGKPLHACSSNFDFSGDDNPASTKLFKLHGTIEKDTSDGFQGRLILTEQDYDLTDDYREFLYDRLKADIGGNSLIVIGHSLADPHIKDIVNRAAKLNAEAMSPGRISLLMYTPDENRAGLYENRGIQVSFGGIDEFFAALAKNGPSHQLVYTASGDVLDSVPKLRPVTIDVAHAATPGNANVSAMFNGWPASHADVAAGLTFQRSIAETVSRDLAAGEPLHAIILGASGLGKTTAARQILSRMNELGHQCWEHRSDHRLQPELWLSVAERLATDGAMGVLLVDDAHHHLVELNELIDGLASAKNTHLKILGTSSRNHWAPRVKTPHFYKLGREYRIQKLNSTEIDRLLNLIDNNPALRSLIDVGFSGFSRLERRRRLVDRCEAETFVCLRNIFASEKFDDIILREYSSLSEPLQEIYRLIAAMENAGIRVHRQLVVRLLGIAADKIATVLSDLEDIIVEYTIDNRGAIYGWRGRHPVIVGIIAKYKFNDIAKLVELFDSVIDAISPTYEIEIRSIRELCNIESGITRIPDKEVQNTLLRKIMSVAPGERVPRHRLVRNLIEMTEYDKAETEIRIFEKDFRPDGPIARYRMNLMVARATKSPGLMSEDRIAILEQARSYAVSVVEKYKNNKNLLSAYCDLAIELFRLNGSTHAFDDAMRELKTAEVRLGDPDVSRLIRSYERKFAGQSLRQVSVDAQT